ncbi:MAG: tetratricopeptide repeat protein [Bacteroidales bacterium]|nr:tetratricopeptide repeat protein [Bacteroidales bacterium]
MKKVLLIVAALIIAANVSAQNTEKLLKSIKKAQENVVDKPSTSSYIKLGDAYFSAYQQLRGDFQVGWNVNEVGLFGGGSNIVSQEEVVKGGIPFLLVHYPTKDLYYNAAGLVESIIVTEKLIEGNLLTEARDAYVKAAELDAKQSKYKDLYKKLISLRDVFVNDAFSYYALSDLANAADYFENSLPCSENPVVGAIDTMIVYYTGVAYNDAGNFAKAKTYFQRCVDLGYMENGDIPAALADILKKEGDIEGAKSCLNAAFQQFPSNQAILVSLINLYLETKDDPTKVLELLHAAQANEPDNASLIYAEGNVYLNLKDYEKAIEFYQKSYDTDNSYFYGIYAVGNTYFELAVQAQTEIDLLDISDIKGYEALTAKMDEYLQKSIEPFEKAFEISDNEDVKTNVALALKQIFFRYREKNPEYAEKYKQYDEYVASKQ